MQFTHSAEYALRIMAQLALQPRDVALRAQDIADSAGVPRHYVSKLLRRLVLAGLLKSEKGHGGGFRLGRAPSLIRFADIFAAVDYVIEPNRCAFGWGKCSTSDPCPIHDAWSEMAKAFRQWAHRSTLASVRRTGRVPDTRALTALLPSKNSHRLRTRDRDRRSS